MAKKAAKEATAKARTKTEVLNAIAETTDLSRKQVASVFEALAGEIKGDLGKKGPGVLTVPGLLKLKVIRKPATKAKPGKNPSTGEDIMIKAKPARNVVKATPLKALKDMV